MNKKIILIIVAFAVVAVGAFALVTATTPGTTGVDNEIKAESEADTSGDDTKSSTSSASADIAAAEELVGQTMSRDEVQEALGEWENFEMTSNGCERGVYAGRFYYKDFTIFSRTYDKGQTFSIVSINE